MSADPSPSRRFDVAIRNRNVPAAWQAAHELPVLSLDLALELTILLGEDRNRRYEASARRFLERLIREKRPSLGQVLQVADALNELPGGGVFPAGEGPADALRQLVVKLHRSGSL